MNPQDFLPEVWHTPDRPAILVCGRRWLRGNQLRGATIDTTWESIVHPVAIGIGPEPQLYFGHRGLPDRDEVWTRDAPETHGLDARAAALALAEAWRCVDAKMNIADFSVECSVNSKRVQEFRGGTPRRNMGIFLKWGLWERDGVSKMDRLEEIKSWGFDMTPNAFRRLIEDSGL
jgi:hypothetical protein